MNLAAGRMIHRLKVDACTMTRMVVNRVELLATGQGYKSLKFFNRKRQEMILENSELLVGVGGQVSQVIEENLTGNLPLEGDDDSSSGVLSINS